MKQERTFFLLNRYKIFLFVIILSFVSMFSLTYNFNLFWEDSYLLKTYSDYEHNPEKYTVKELTKLFVTTLFSPFKPSELNKKTCGNCCSVYRLNYLCRPLSENMYLFLVAPFGINVIHHRIAKTILYSLLMLIYLYFFLKPLQESCEKSIKPRSTSRENTLFFLLLTGYLLVLPELFIAVLYYVDLLLLTTFCATLALFLFYFFYNKNLGMMPSSLLFLGIIIFTQISILTKHVGRINFALIFLFLLITDRKKLLQPK